MTNPAEFEIPVGRFFVRYETRVNSPACWVVVWRETPEFLATIRTFEQQADAVDEAIRQERRRWLAPVV